VVLSATNLRWLEQLPGSVAADDLDVTYSFPHELNHSRELAKQILQGSGDDENLLWHIQIYNADGEKVLKAPLSRKIYASTPLRAVRENGPVVYNALFLVNERFKRQGLAKRVYTAEGRLYKKWRLREVHLNAREDGLVVWVKSFGFLPRLPAVLATEYEDWAQRRRMDPTPPSRPADYPEEFLRSRDTLDLYKVI